MCEPSQINARPHYIDLTEVDSYQLKLNEYKSLLEQCGAAGEWCDLTCTSQLTDCSSVQQNSTRKIKSFEESLLWCNSFFLSQKSMVRASEKAK